MGVRKMKNRKVKGCLTVFCLCLLFSACSKEEKIVETQQETMQVSETEDAIEDTLDVDETNDTHIPSKEDVLAMSEIGSFDMIITDVRMPVMDGIEEVRQIRALKRTDAATIPIIALTADAFNSEREEAAAIGMTTCLIKPVEPELLYATVSGILKMHKQ